MNTQILTLGQMPRQVVFDYSQSRPVVFRALKYVDRIKTSDASECMSINQARLSPHSVFCDWEATQFEQWIQTFNPHVEMHYMYHVYGREMSVHLEVIAQIPEDQYELYQNLALLHKLAS